MKMVEELMNPIGLMDGDNLPVSAFKDIADGQFELGASAYEKRGTAVQFLNGMLRNVSSVTSVHLYVPTLRSVRSW